MYANNYKSISIIVFNSITFSVSMNTTNLGKRRTYQTRSKKRNDLLKAQHNIKEFFLDIKMLKTKEIDDIKSSLKQSFGKQLT